MQLRRYPLRDLGEPPLPDGWQVRRPVVPVRCAGQEFLGVVDSGSPITLFDGALLPLIAVDPEYRPIFDVPVGVGASFVRLEVYEVRLTLDGLTGEPGVTWTLPAAAHPRWRMPFSVLFGQRGWFDRFPTTIGADGVTVALS